MVRHQAVVNYTCSWRVGTSLKGCQIVDGGRSAAQTTG
jgi:hypothetical protein